MQFFHCPLAVPVGAATVYRYMETNINNAKSYSTTSERIREIRMYRELKQFNVARLMNISQQAYSSIETKSGNIKVGTLKRVCDVIGVDLSFLLAHRIAITSENMAIFDTRNYAAVYADYKKLKSKVLNMENLLLKIPAHKIATA